MSDFKPNFFIVGASKCGTSALADALNSHPDVYMSAVKEPNFFNKFDASGESIRCEDYETYAQHFALVKDEKIVGESSVSYLVSDKAAFWISNANPDAKILVIIRNPLSRIRSLYEMYVRHGYAESFQHAIETDGFLVEQSRYSENIERYLEAFPRNQVMIVEHGELLENWDKVTRKLFNFLGIDDRVEIQKVIKNTGGMPRNPVGKLLSKRPIVKFAKKLLPKSYWKSTDRLVKKVFFKKMDLSEKQINYLKDKLREDVVKLSDLVGKDLCREWLEK